MILTLKRKGNHWQPVVQEFCCRELSLTIQWDLFSWGNRDNSIHYRENEKPHLYLYGGQQPLPIKFCPFCKKLIKIFHLVEAKR